MEFNKGQKYHPKGEPVMKRVFFQGAFDLFNYGHVRAIEDAKKQGDWLIIGLNSDNLIRRYKEREPILPYKQRKAILEAIKWVDEVIPMDCFSPIAKIMDDKMRIDVYVVGSEWVETKITEIENMKKKGGKVFVTPEYPGVIHSTEIRRRCVEETLAKQAS